MDCTGANNMLRKDLLKHIIEKATWLNGPGFACRQGCASCCTQSVTLTTLEGEIILQYLKDNDRDVSDMLSSMQAQYRLSYWPRMTTNQFARHCLDGKDFEEGAEPEASWNLGPCFFLDKGCCSIYPARPFSCRAMVSQKHCDQGGAAEMASELVTLNSMWLQLIEHLDQGGYWGNMVDVLANLADQQMGEATAPIGDNAQRLLKNQPLPGFLIPPEEQEATSRALAGLFQTEIDGQPFSRLFKAVHAKS